MYACKLNDIEQLTQKHNTAGMGKLYCVLEEASPYRRAHRAPKKLKDTIDSEIQRIVMIVGSCPCALTSSDH